MWDLFLTPRIAAILSPIPGRVNTPMPPARITPESFCKLPGSNSMGHRNLHYSVRSARMGSTLAARPAGTADAASATTVTPATASR